MQKTRDIRKVVNENIAKYMKREGLTREGICEKIGIHKTTWSRKFNCEGDSSFNLVELGLIARALKVTVVDLVVDTDQDLNKKLYAVVDMLRNFIPAQ